MISRKMSTLAIRTGIALLACVSAQPLLAQSVLDLPAQLGPRPFYLVDKLNPGPLKDTLTHCASNTREYTARDFSIAHRGAALQFPEHTKESYEAAARMGSGIIECDVTFTADGELVCRHAQCDLHTTTNILATPLAEKCAIPFAPAEYDDLGNLLNPATARCCASDLTLQEFKSLAEKWTPLIVLQQPLMSILAVQLISVLTCMLVEQLC